MRRLYNESGGSEGAYVVATNYSLGIDNAFGTDPQYFSWCNMYDLMGAVGIVSVGATTNEETNVDVEGDMPTTCPSPYLISVTSVDPLDNKVARAGFGPINIDLGAPGQDVQTLSLNSGYNDFGGTSGATPHVAGAIGLLFSLECEAFTELSINEPEMAAQMIVDAILNGTDPNSSLTGLTKTNGRLNIFEAIINMTAFCEDINIPSPKGPLSIENISYASSSLSVTVNYVSPDENPYEILISDVMGRILYQGDFTPPRFGEKALTIPIASSTNGLYIISVYNESAIASKSFYLFNH